MAANPPFVPAVVDAMVPAVPVDHERETRRCKAKPEVRARRCDAWGIEIEAEGVHYPESAEVRIWR